MFYHFKIFPISLTSKPKIITPNTRLCHFALMGADVCMSRLIEYQVPEEENFAANALSLQTGWGAKGFWAFDVEQGGSSYLGA